MTGWIETGAGLLAGGLVGGAGYALGALTASAGLGVALAGLLSFGLAGWDWGTTLLVAVLSNCLWARYHARGHGRADLWSRRGWPELAAAVCWPVALSALVRSPARQGSLLAAFTGAVAVFTADAWATEVGMLSRELPRMLISRRRVAHGMPGAVSPLGTVAALGGAWFVGLTGLALSAVRSATKAGGQWDRSLLWLPLSAALGGVAGSVLDSFLGATAQALYHCEQCNAYCETPIHTCGRPANPVRGWPWLTSEGVDWVSAVVGAALSAGLYTGLARSGVPW